MWSFFSRDPSRDFNYDVGEPVAGLEDKSTWRLHKGRKKNGGEPVSIFVYDIKSGSDVQLEIVKASLKKLKTLRHPCITTFLDSLETDKVIYMVTEYVVPLVNFISLNEPLDNEKELRISWGLHQVIKGIHFLNNDCSLVHNNICLWSVFVNQAGEWKLGSLEYTCAFSEVASPPIKILPLLEKYDPPEKADSNSKKAVITKWSIDMWGLGCLIWEVFNGSLNKSSSLKNIGQIPKSLVPHYCELVGANASLRPSPQEFLSRCRVKGGYFNNNFVNTLLFLEEIQIKDNNEKTKFFSGLTPVLDSFPQDICKYKILPQLLHAFEFGNAGSSVLSPMFKLGKLLDEEEYQKKIVPCLVKLFSSTDRSTRARLLQQMEHFVDHLQPSLINDQIFPQVIHGFLDTNPTIREVTVKAMLYLAPKLNYNNLNVELMKHFARLQAKDEQGGIRTNTTICLGKIATFLYPQIRQKVLIAAFSRAMHDPFPPARTAGIMALAATQNFYTLHDVASKVIPALSPSCTDGEKTVRDQAFKTIKGFLSKLEKVSEDPSLAIELEAEVNTITSPTVADTAASWAGWAVTSLTSKFYKTSKPKPISSEEQSKNVPETNPNPVQSRNNADEIKSGVEKLQIDSGKMDSEAEDDWNDDWGQMDISSSNKAENSSSKSDNAYVDANDWDDDWASMEEDDKLSIDQTRNEALSISKTNKNDWNEEMVESGFVPSDPSLKPASAYNWENKNSTDDEFFTMQKPISRQMSQDTTTNKQSSSGWDVDDAPWETWQASSEATSKPMDKTQREERRLQRQKELQEKRAARQTAGAMKLGSKKKYCHDNL